MYSSFFPPPTSLELDRLESTGLVSNDPRRLKLSSYSFSTFVIQDNSKNNVGENVSF